MVPRHEFAEQDLSGPGSPKIRRVRSALEGHEVVRDCQRFNLDAELPRDQSVGIIFDSWSGHPRS